MKVAVCFSGTVRNPEIALESLKLIRPGNHIKIFAHTWSNLNTETDYLNGSIDHSDTSLLQGFNFETFLIENYQSKKIHFQKMYDFFNFKIHHATPRTDLGIISMFYSIYQSNLLKRNYETLNKLKFDKVIRMRFDSNFENKILDLTQLNSELNIPNEEDWCGGINDQFAVGTSELMDVYCDMYNSFSLIRHVPYHPESMFGEYLKIRQVNLDRFDFKVSITSNRPRHY